MKNIRVTFRKKVEEKEIAERQIDEAFDILFAEVIKRIQKEKIHLSLINGVSAKGGDYIWAS